jgi:hypothetical protein
MNAQHPGNHGGRKMQRLPVSPGFLAGVCICGSVHAIGSFPDESYNRFHGGGIEV